MYELYCFIPISQMKKLRHSKGNDLPKATAAERCSSGGRKTGMLPGCERYQAPQPGTGAKAWHSSALHPLIFSELQRSPGTVPTTGHSLGDPPGQGSPESRQPSQGPCTTRPLAHSPLSLCPFTLSRPKATPKGWAPLSPRDTPSSVLPRGL